MSEQIFPEEFRNQLRNDLKESKQNQQKQDQKGFYFNKNRKLNKVLQILAFSGYNISTLKDNNILILRNISCALFFTYLIAKKQNLINTFLQASVFGLFAQNYFQQWSLINSLKKRALFYEDEESIEIKNLMLYYFPEEFDKYILQQIINLSQLSLSK